VGPGLVYRSFAGKRRGPILGSSGRVELFNLQSEFVAPVCRSASSSRGHACLVLTITRQAARTWFYLLGGALFLIYLFPIAVRLVLFSAVLPSEGDVDLRRSFWPPVQVFPDPGVVRSTKRSSFLVLGFSSTVLYRRGILFR